METFEDALSSLLNRYSQENGSDTPDFLLARYLTQCLEAYNLAVTEREKWHQNGAIRNLPNQIAEVLPADTPEIPKTIGVTTDRNDPRLGRGVDEKPIPQHDVYLVLSEEERAKGFVRPVRRRYIHVGKPAPQYPLRDLTAEERERYKDCGYGGFEPYPPERSPVTGRFWTQKDLENCTKTCGAETTMGITIAETYARNPDFYGSTYCVGCGMHRPVGPDGEFIWSDGSGKVGT